MFPVTSDGSRDVIKNIFGIDLHVVIFEIHIDEVQEQ